MIYTVTLNPSLDYVLTGSAVCMGQVNRMDAAQTTFGGKGISQSVILTRLGIPNCALGLAGGYTGRRLQQLLRTQGVKEELVEVRGETRVNVKLRAGQETEINAPGPEVSQQELQRLLERLDGLHKGDVLSFGGSASPGVASTVIRDILHRLAGREIFTVVDADGELLRHSLEGRPSLIKPNLHEAAQLLGLAEDHPNFAREAAGRLQAMGARNVLLSMGGDGAALLTAEGDFFELAAPKGAVRGTTGAGDSLLAGFLAGLTLKRGWFGALHLGVAVGSATAFAGRLADRDEILTVEAKMKMR
ncbi:MAG: 1-phosphofructokinase family hexose kinase [Oscillospiraceae bacterium]|nr:1-phosphofructokinase family hexose kinase [Oscillospiraceae bacterium]